MKKSDMLATMANASEDSCAALDNTLKRIAPEIAQVVQMMASSIRRGGKILICGNGGSAADAQHMAGELVGRFLKEREPYPAIALTTDTSIISSLSNDYGFDMVFERQVNALGTEKDVLLAISTSGNSKNVILAIRAAGSIGMKTVGLTGKGGGKMARSVDILLDADSKSTPRIQEVHGFIIHIICDLVEQLLCEKK